MSARSIAAEPRNLTVAEAAGWVGGYPDTPQGHENFRRVWMREIKKRGIAPIYWGRELRIPSTVLVEVMRSKAGARSRKLRLAI